MSFSIGIVGLPNAGKSTLFKALTKLEVEIAPYPFTTIDPNVGQVPVRDERLEKIAEALGISEQKPVLIEFIDIAGLIKNAHKGEGLGNQFLSQIRGVDLILNVLAAYKKEDPIAAKEIIELELIMKDIEVLERRLEKLSSIKDAKEKALIEKIISHLKNGTPLREIHLTQEEKEILKSYQLLTEKPIVYLINIDGKEKEERYKESFSQNSIFLNLRDELDISELTPEERESLGLFPSLDLLIQQCYNTLNLITFFTVAKEKEVRAWIALKDENILEAAQKVHSDFREKFKKAEVINWEDLLAFSSWKEAREKGALKIVGKDYLLKDGDVIEFKI